MTITVQVARPLLYKGERNEIGMRLDVTPLEAADLLASGRATLVRDADSNDIREAVQKENRRVVPRAREPWR